MMTVAKELFKFIKKHDSHKAVYDFINPILTDVSLRDGIQALDTNSMPTQKKIDMFHEILNFGGIKNIEMGSLVSHKHYPIMKDVQTIHNYAAQYLDNREPTPEMMLASESNAVETPDLYVLVPNKEKLINGMKANIMNFSFITSVSNSFQKKNTNKTLNENNIELINMMEFLKHAKYPCPYKTKLYISCIDHCPIEGKINNDAIVEEIIIHSFCEYNEICLSDTCGKLTYENYKNIVDQCLDEYNLNPDSLSVHLHVNDGNLLNIENIIRYSLNRKIHRFDISMLNSGGCTMTIQNNELNRNLDYDLFFSILYKYVDESVQKLEKTGK
jgi:hydroxymethylglutaryl-CoA lyase